MKYLTIDELKECYISYLLNNFKLAETKARSLADVLDIPDIIHEVESYMSEYIDEVTIDNEVYLHYHCWFLDAYSFAHETYYLKEDIKDGTVESYIKAKKFYSI